MICAMTSWASLLVADGPQRRVSVCQKGRANSGVCNNKEAMDHRSSDVEVPETQSLTNSTKRHMPVELAVCPNDQVLAGSVIGTHRVD
jgi:hypothetical protein